MVCFIVNCIVWSCMYLYLSMKTPTLYHNAFTQSVLLLKCFIHQYVNFFHLDLLLTLYGIHTKTIVVLIMFTQPADEGVILFVSTEENSLIQPLVHCNVLQNYYTINEQTDWLMVQSLSRCSTESVYITKRIAYNL